MKKLLKVFSLIFILFLTSCTLPGTQNSSETYTIKYYVEGVLVESTSYKKGETPELYLYQINPNDNAIFDGWYDNATYSGEIITGISTDATGNLSFYGRIIEDNSIDLESLLSINNYSYTLVDSVYNDELEYKITERIQELYCLQFSAYPYYLEYLDDTSRFTYNDQNNWYYSLDGENAYSSYIDFFNLIDLRAIDAENFTYNESTNSFVCKTDKLAETVQAFASNYITSRICSEFVIELNTAKTQINKIYFTVEEYSKNNTYTFTFSNINTTRITVPQATYDNGVYGGAKVTGISELHNLYSGADATATGIVTGIYGNNFYLTDNSGSILVYCGNNSSYLPIVEDGKVIKVSGIISIYKDIAQIIDITEISVVDKTISAPATDLNNVSQSALENNPAGYVNVKKATLLSVPTYSSTSDMSFEVSYNNVDVTIFISRHLDSASKSSIVNTLTSIGQNGKVDLLNLHISKYTEYQLVCTSVTSVKKNTDALVVVEINATPSKISLEEGATIDDVLENVIINKIFDDYSSEQVNINEVTYQTNFVENKVGVYVIVFSYKDLTCDATIDIYEKGTGYIKTEVTEAPNKETARNFKITTGLPSTGSPKVLVIPVTFIDYPASNSLVSDLEKAFFGTSEETGWESLQSYYYKASYGKLNITGTVLQPYKTNQYASYYDNRQDYDYEFIKGALEYYNDQIDYSDYDTDNDGYIDSIYVIYTRDYDYEGDTNWWAYTYEYFTDDYEFYDGVEADFYTFMSIQFFSDKLQEKTVKYNCETVIHETGHLLGLDDYYDYTENKGPEGGIGGGDMMDYNVGDHNAFSKVLLGWINPYVLTGSNVSITLNSFEKSGDCIIVPKNWNGSFYSEYFIIDYYTPTGVNAFVKGQSGLFGTYGIRIYHINAELLSYNDVSIIYAMTKYNNSDTTYRLITLVEADGRNDIDNKGWSEDSDLFKAGDVYSTAKWHNNTSANFTMTVNSITTTANLEKAVVTFKFK